ncbi:uncharacterized protein LOC127078947 [Lathyrus oleraceus]|uniref:uncharacterized protein LOC127078947 n=1 Tax=Pisum sativum TaxID=3888 RepID=UPI0021D15A08|nr:uncharacterized protein LOC127078947 [Pisum sativum]
MSKFQLLTTMFENLRMNEDESIYDFNIRLRDIANTSLSLGKKMSMENLDRKILRSLPKKFNMKVMTIEKVQDLGRIKVDELISSLQTFEMALNDISEKKKKGITFMSNTEEYEGQNKSKSIAIKKRKAFEKVGTSEKEPHVHAHIIIEYIPVNEEVLSNPIMKDIDHTGKSFEEPHVEPRVKSHVDSHVEPNVGKFVPTYGELQKKIPQEKPGNKRRKVEVKVVEKKYLKRKLVQTSDSEIDVEVDVLDITLSSRRKIGGKRVIVNIPSIPLDNVSFYSEESVQNWKYVCKRIVASKRELRKDVIEWQEIKNLSKDVGLMTIVSDMGPCYENMVKEFIVNLSPECNVEGSQEYMKVCVRGKCVKFSPFIIDAYMGITK